MRNMTDIFLQHPGIEAFGLAILHSLWQGALIAAALFIVLQFVKNNANLRYLLACGALMCLLLAFGYTFYLSYTPPVQATNGSSMPAFTTSNHIISQVFIPQSADIEEEKAFSFANAQTAIVDWIERNSHYIFLLWLAGFLVFSSRLCLGLYYARKLKRSGQQPEAIWIHKLDQFRHTVGIKRAVRLLTSAQVHTPFTLGWIRPVILLPVEMLTQLPCEHIESILLHELAHIRRRDYLVNLLQSVVESLLFFNPAYWYMARIIERERENACDDMAVSIIRQPVNYARALTRVAELSRVDGVLSKATVAASRGSLTERIRRIVLASAGQTIQRSEKTKWYLMGIIAIAVLAAVMITAEVRGHQSEKNVEMEVDADPEVEVDIEEEVDVEKEVNVDLDIEREEDIEIDLGVEVDAVGARLDSSSLYNFLHSQWEYIKKRKIAKGEEAPDNVLLSNKTLYIVDGVARDPKTIKPPFDYTISIPHTVMGAAILLFDFFDIEDSYAAFRKKYPGNYNTVVFLTSKALKDAVDPDEPFTVNGQVFNSRDIPLSGVKVQLKGENRSTFTDAEGRFKIRVPHSRTILTFSNPGIYPSVIEWLVGDWYRDKKMYVRWRERKSPKENLPDVKIQRTEDNNDEKTMQKGQVQISSVSNSGNPIFIVDGKRFDDKQLSLLEPGDIASINVLKGEEAKKIYGEKGKNGVILITTKAGVEAEKEPLSPMIDSRPPLFVIDGIRYTYQELSNFNAGDGKSVTVKSGNSQFQINLNPDDIISMNVQSGGLGITSSSKKPVDVVFIKTKRGTNQYPKEPEKPTSPFNLSEDKVLYLLDGVKTNAQTIKSSNAGKIEVIRLEDATFYNQKLVEEYRQKYSGNYEYIVAVTSKNKNIGREINFYEKTYAYDRQYFSTLKSFFDYYNDPSHRNLSIRVDYPLPNSFDGKKSSIMSVVDGTVQNWWPVKPHEVSTVEVYQRNNPFSYFYHVENGYGHVSIDGKDKLEYLRKSYPGEYDELLIITTKKSKNASKEIESSETSDNLTVFPNPSENIFTIQLTLAEDAPVQVSVIDAAGRLVTSLTDRSVGKGLLELKWDASDQKPGLYRIRIIQNGETTYRNVLVK